MNDRNCTWVGAFPKDDPKYILLVGLDNPKATKTTHGYATAGWNAAAVAGRIISRFAPLMGVQPVQTYGNGKAGEIQMLKHTVEMGDTIDTDTIYDDEG